MVSIGHKTEKPRNSSILYFEIHQSLIQSFVSIFLSSFVSRQIVDFYYRLYLFDDGMEIKGRPIWLSYKTKKQTKTCDKDVRMSDQGIFFKILNYKALDEENFITAATGLPVPKKRSKREGSRFIPRDELNAELGFLQKQIIFSLKKNLKINALARCMNMQQVSNWLVSLAPSSPTSVARLLLRKYSLVGIIAGHYLTAYPCFSTNLS